MKENRLNIANILTFSRIILGFVFFFLFLQTKIRELSNINILIIEILSLFIIIIAIITDGLDGYFARKEGKVTSFGKHFDPLSDSIFFIIVFLSFLMLGLMKWYFFVIVLLREGFMHIFLRPYIRSKGSNLPANIFGKIKTVFQATLSIIILTALIFKEILVIYFPNETVIKTYNYTLNIVSYISFAIITFLSLFSLSIYLINLKKSFSLKKNS